MLTTDQQYILALIRKSFQTDTQIAIRPENRSYIVSVLYRNGILLTVYNALEQEMKNDLAQRYHIALKQSFLQNYEGEQALAALSDAGMNCIALKGWEIRKLYPNMNSRQMADLDILVKPYNYASVKKTMEKLGYRGKSESSWKHDSFIKGEVHIEMHKRLTDDSNSIQRWESEMWSKAIRVRDNIFKMSPEDYYVFHFVHLHKDFMNGSLGLRRIVDTWLLQKQMFDRDAVNNELEKFGLRTFHDRLVELSRAVMGEIPMDENCEILLSHAFKHGIYGSEVSYKAGRIAAMGKDIKSGKRSSAINAVFLPYKRMKAQFPVLEKYPILLPWCWTRRIVHFLRGDLKKSRARLDYSNINEDDYQEMKRFFDAGGV